MESQDFPLWEETDDLDELPTVEAWLESGGQMRELAPSFPDGDDTAGTPDHNRRV